MVLDLLIYVARCLIVLLAAWLAVQFIGKKTVAQMTPYDISILFIILSLASHPLASRDPFKTATGMVLLGLGTVAIAKLSLLRPFYKVNFEPTVLIERGVILESALRQHRISLYTLMSMLRVQGYFQLEDVHYAILEANGALSVLPKSSIRPLTPGDMNRHPKQQEPSFAVVVDGRIMTRMLPSAGVTADWLVRELRSRHDAAPEEVFFAELNADKQLNVQKYEKAHK